MDPQSLLPMFCSQNRSGVENWQSGNPAVPVLPQNSPYAALEDVVLFNPAGAEPACAVGGLMSSRESLIKEEVITGISADRRTGRRYDIGLPVRYKVLGSQHVSRSGAGKTVNLSGEGIAFEMDGVLAPGSRVELAIAWPVRLHGTCALKLVVTGKVVRSYRALTAIRMERYEFRTQGTPVQPLKTAAAGSAD